uniref:Reverse transcriptase domain-containing protein n=1 Tax=Tanacetum cinerariifolium TaxID=118510 RepID=A0A699GW32_TANCI|nr:reverse transcriptase domain-containing protein [Tanacetum cinerariifolium]
MIQQVQSSCQFHGLPGDDANKHIDKFLHVTQSIKVNGVTDDALRLYLFPHSLTHHAIDWLIVFQGILSIHLSKWLKCFWKILFTFHAQQSESSSSITSSNLEIVALKAEMPPLAKPRTYMLQEPIKVIFLTNLKIETSMPNSKPVVAPVVVPVVALVSAPKPNQKLSIPYPSRLHDQKLHDKANDQKEKFFQIFKDLNFNISFADALILMPKFGLTIKSLLTNKDKPFELARTPLNKHCLMVLLKKLPKKLGDPGKFLILCDFPRIDECLALADLNVSINLMPLSVWNKIFLPELTPTLMTLELADQLISRPISVAEDVYVKVGKFHFPADFIVVDFDADPRLDQTSRYSANYNDMTANQMDVIDMACEEYSQEVLNFSNVIANGNPTFYYDPIVSTSSLTLTPFGDCDFLLKEVDAFLALEDDSTSREVDHSYNDPKEDILLFEAFFNDDPSLPSPTQGMYLLQVKKELKICEAKNDKSLIDEPPEVKLKDLPPHLEYAFLEGDDMLPVIIAKDLSVEEKAALIKVLKSYKQAIAWKLFDIKGIDPEFCTYKILMEDDFKPAVQHHKKVNPKINDVIKKEILKLLDARLIYPISDSPWVSPVQCVPKKGGFTVVENEENELIPTRLVLGCITLGMTPFCLKSVRIKSSGDVYMARKPLTFSRLATMEPPEDIMARTTPPKRCLTLVFIGPQSIVMPTTWSNLVTLVDVKDRFRNEMKCLKIPNKFVKFLTFGASISWGRSCLHEATSIYSWLSITCQNGSERKRSPPMTPELFANF